MYLPPRLLRPPEKGEASVSFTRQGWMEMDKPQLLRGTAAHWSTLSFRLHLPFLVEEMGLCKGTGSVLGGQPVYQLSLASAQAPGGGSCTVAPPKDEMMSDQGPPVRAHRSHPLTQEATLLTCSYSFDRPALPRCMQCGCWYMHTVSY